MDFFYKMLLKYVPPLAMDQIERENTTFWIEYAYALVRQLIETGEILVTDFSEEQIKLLYPNGINP